MARKKRPNRNFHNIPKWNPAKLYVYFNDLEAPTEYPYMDMFKRILYGKAKGYYDSLLNDLDITSTPSETIDQSIKFLGAVAENERRKEIHVVETYINDIFSQLPDELKGNNTYNHSSASELISLLKDFSKSFSSGTTDYSTIDIQHFYQTLTLLINTIRGDIDDFKETLERISFNRRDKMSSLADRAAIYRYESDLESMFKNLIGIATKQTEESFSSTIRALIFDYFAKNSNYRSNINIRDHFPAVLAGMLADFEQYIQHHKPKDQGFNADLSNSLMSLFNQYIEQSNTLFLNRLQDLLNNENEKVDNTFTQSLERFEHHVGIKFNTMTQEQIEERKKAIKRQQADIRKAIKNGEISPKKRNYLYKSLRALGETAFANSFQFMTWIPRTDGSKGTIYEAVQDIIGNSIHIGGSGATDNIRVLGILQADVNSRAYDDFLTQGTQDMVNELAREEIKERVDRFQNSAEGGEIMNQRVRTISENLSTTLNSLENISDKTQNLFVFHESLKLYSSMEWDIEETKDGKTAVGRQAKHFEGRNMIGLNFLDELYLLEDIAGVELPDKTQMYGLLMNLNSSSVAGGDTSKVENYLALFAGMLLFTDARNMAEETVLAAQNQLSSSVHQVHLYLLNGVYVPGSYILTTVHNAVQAAYGQLSLSNGIDVNINTKGAAAIVDTYVQNRAAGMPYQKNLQDWEDQANAIASSIKIKMKFLSGFVSFVQALNKQF